MSTSFQSLLSSIGGQKGAPPANASTNPPKKPNPGPGASVARVTPATNGVSRPVANNVAAGVKRKPEGQVSAPQAKTVKTEVKVPVRPAGANTQSSVSKPTSSTAAPTGPYRGTLKPSAPLIASRPSAAAKPTPTSSTTTTANGDAAPKPKKGFAAILEKAKLAQEAAKAAGPSTIKHKPVEKLTKRERLRKLEDAKQNAGGKGGKLAANDRSRSGTPVDPKAAKRKLPVPETGYKGTMKNAVMAKPQPQISYSGTMRKADPSAPKPPAKKGLAQDKYGGYASWSDLDDAEDEEEGYDDDSDDMEAGFTDVEGEEQSALKAARKEDLEALQEEERHKREKEERKRKLQALSKSAASRKKF